MHPCSWKVFPHLAPFLSYLATIEAHGKCKSVQNPILRSLQWLSLSSGDKASILGMPLKFPVSTSLPHSPTSLIPAVPGFVHQPEWHQGADIPSFLLSFLILLILRALLDSHIFQTGPLVVLCELEPLSCTFTAAIHSCPMIHPSLLATISTEMAWLGSLGLPLCTGAGLLCFLALENIS